MSVRAVILGLAWLALAGCKTAQTLGEKPCWRAS